MADSADLRTKLSILADAAKYDASCASSGVTRRENAGGIGNSEGMGICHSYTPDGRCVSLLKILLTNHCIYDCAYCVNRVSSQVRRAKFSVSEVVALTMSFYRRNYIEGLFLSSGVIRSADDTMEEMVEIARRLREEERFGGYIHLKAVAGCSSEMLSKAGLHADRLSANIELPTQPDLDRLAPAKTHVEIEESMSAISGKIAEAKEDATKFASTPKFAPGGQSTQMIVGATASTDHDILLKASELYSRHRLKRVYYSAFSPIPDANPNLPAERPPLVREHRLYQSDWLSRFYGFRMDEILSPGENLDLRVDPKLGWALRHRHFFPVDVNRAPREALLRVPGLGVKVVDKILSARRFRRLRLEDLGKLHVPMAKVRHFLRADGMSAERSLLSSLELERAILGEEQLDLFGDPGPMQGASGTERKATS